MKYGVICAMEEEIKALKENLELTKQTDINGVIFTKAVLKMSKLC